MKRKKVGVDKAPTAEIKEAEDYQGHYVCALVVTFSDGEGWLLSGTGRTIEEARQNLADWLDGFRGRKLS